MLGGGFGTKGTHAASKLARTKTYYSGIPKARMRGSDVKVFGDFDDYNGEVWGTDNIDYATAMSKSKRFGGLAEDAEGNWIRSIEEHPEWDGEVHKFAIDPDELKTYTMPQVEGQASGAGQMPYQLDASGKMIAKSGDTNTLRVGNQKVTVAVPDYHTSNRMFTSQNEAARYMFKRGYNNVELPNTVDADWAGNLFKSNTVVLSPGTTRYNYTGNKLQLLPRFYNQASGKLGATIGSTEH